MQKWWVLLVRAIAQDLLLIIIKSFIMGFALLGNSSLGQINPDLLVSATLLRCAAVLVSTGGRISDLPVVVSLVLCYFFPAMPIFDLTRPLTLLFFVLSLKQHFVIHLCP